MSLPDPSSQTSASRHANQAEPSNVIPSNGVYAGYETWKQWDNLFAPTKDEIESYSIELDGCIVRGGAVFEIGFGAGGFLAWAESSGASIAGCEIIPALVEAAEARAIDLLPPDFETVAGHHRSRFDTIVAFDVFEHFTHDEIVKRLKACDIMLKPGGHLVLRFPNAQSPFGLSPLYGDITHISPLSKRMFEQLVRDTSLKPVRYGNAARPKGTGLRLVYRAASGLLRGVIGHLLEFAYGQGIPFDPVVTLVLRKA